MSEKRRKQMDFSPYESAVNIVRDALAALETLAGESEPLLREPVTMAMPSPDIVRDLGGEEWPYGQVSYDPGPPTWTGRRWGQEAAAHLDLNRGEQIHTTAQAEAGEGPFPEDEEPGGKWRERNDRDSWLAQPVNMAARSPREDLLGAAAGFMEQAGLDPTSDAVEQLTDAFLPCLALMCEREMDHSKPDGSTWKVSGWRGSLFMVKHKMERIWHKAWEKGEPGQSEMYDLINYAGFYIRSRNEPGKPWGKWDHGE